MNSTAYFVSLDFRTIRPYRRSLYLSILIALIIGVALGSTSTLSAIFMMGLIVLMSYPFSVGEKNGMDTLYATLPLKRRNVVMGRYVFVLCLEIIGMIFVLLLSVLLATVFRTDVNIMETLFSLCVLSAVFSLIVSLQYPIYFKLGYAKAKIYAYIPLLIIFLLIMLVAAAAGRLAATSNLDTIWAVISASPYLMYGLPIGIGLLLLVLSCALSCKLYEKRDI